MQSGYHLCEIQAEHELRERKNISPLSSSQTSGAMLLTTMDGRCLDVNQSFVEIVGYTREEVLGENDFGIGLWLSKERREKTVAHVRKRGSIRNYETRVRTKKRGAKGRPCIRGGHHEAGNEYIT